MLLKTRVRLFSCTFLCCAISASVCSKDVSDWQQACQNNFCEAIIDAGSSGSRIYVYAKTDMGWQVVYNKRITPGLSSVSVADVGKYLDDLVVIQPQKNMPIFLYGTAGMRLLSDADQRLRYQAATSWFYQHANFELKSARTITGQEEGVFAWVAVHEEMGLLDKPVDTLRSVVEIGGASAQVSVPVTDSEAKALPPSEIYPLQWNHHTIQLWSKSFLGLGINEVEKKLSNVSYCFSNGYPLKNGTIGEGDITACVQQMETMSDLGLLNQLQEAKTVVTHHPKNHWVALGAIRFSALKAPYRFDNHQFSLQQLKNQGDEQLCHQDWLSLVSKWSNDPYLYRGCFSASYFYSYLQDGIGIGENDNIYYPDDNAQMDWTLGALLLG